MSLPLSSHTARGERPSSHPNASTLSGTNTSSDASKDQMAPSHSSRSPSRTPRMSSSTLPSVPHLHDTALRTLDQTINTIQSAVDFGHPQDHSILTQRSPPILQPPKSSSSSQSHLPQQRTHPAHISFPEPSIMPAHSSGTATPADLGKIPTPPIGVIRAAEMTRVVSSPLPLPSAKQASASRTEPRPARGRAFSFSRSSSKSRGSSPSGRREWLSRLPGSLVRRGRPRAGSDSSTRSTQTVNIAEVLTHRDRMMSPGSVTSVPTLHPEEEIGDDVFAYSVPHLQNSRTVDSGYGFDELSTPESSVKVEDEEELTARGRWWNSESRRPWSSGSALDREHKDTQKQHHEQIPADETLRTTKEKVLRATSYIGEGAHELLAVGADVLEFAPVPGLAAAAKVLLSIWDAAQDVDLNKKVCLRLTERCATILISIREEIEQADGVGSPKPSPTLIGSPRAGHLPTPPSGPSPLTGGIGSGRGVHTSPKIGSATSPRDSPRNENDRQQMSPQPDSRRLWGEELAMPMERLVGAFNKVLTLLQKQNSRPFLKRYLKREEIQLELTACDAALNDALSVFGVAIQVRILKHVLQAEQQRQAETAAIFDRILNPPALSPHHDTQTPPLTMPGFHPGLLSPQRETVPHPGAGLGLENMSVHGQPVHLDSLGIPNLPDLESESYQPPTEISFPVPVHYPAIPVIPADLSNMSSQEVMGTITHLSEVQNSHDLAQDTAGLRQLLRKAVATNDDFEMLRVLQVRKEEMPEAIKALQRALESEIMKEWGDKERVEKEKQMTEKEQGPALIDEHLVTSPVEDVSVGSLQGIVDGIVGDPVLGTKNEQQAAPVPSADQHVEDPERFRKSTTGSHGTKSSESSSSGNSRDTLDREFIESSIESLLRLSTSSGTAPAALSLPSWTITRYEVIRHAKIGQGNFSEVWRGSYRKRTVAVKVLAPWTPRELFIREVIVWDELRHPNILELIGASAYDASGHLQHTSGKSIYGNGGLESSVHSSGAISTSSGWDVPEEARSPWFFVSRYYERGSLVKWVKGLDQGVWDGMLDDVGQGVLRMIHEIVRGMVYLHDKGVYHGDLKCANILVDDFGHCIISDFGQSEMKSEAYRISGHPLPHGTLRWQSPELMSGASNLTPQVDVYAFAISCVELLTKGGVPWFLASDDTVRHFVLEQDKRPEPPLLRNWSLPLLKIFRECWDRSPDVRPTFKQLDQEFVLLRRKFGWNGIEVVQAGEVAHEKDWQQWIDGLDKDALSPTLTVVPLPTLPPDVTAVDLPSLTQDTESILASRRTTRDSASSGGRDTSSMYRHASRSEPDLPQPPLTEVMGDAHSAPEPTASHEPLHASHYPSRASSIAYPSSTDHSGDYGDFARTVTPPPTNPRVADIRNERRYRLTLQHEYHPSLILPLWTPSPVFIGDVGYHRKPTGTFVTLFNAFKPSDSSEASIQRMSSINGYVNGAGTVPRKEEKLEKRTVAQRGMDLIQGWLSRGKSETNSLRNVGRRYSAPLRNGHKAAHLFTESTLFRFIDDVLPAKRWFQANVDEVLRVYGDDHPIQREDILLVICTLDAANYAMFVSHHHPDSLVNFNVFASSRPGQPWGNFSITPDPATIKHGGPVFHEEVPGTQSASKVSVSKKNSDNWDTILLSRLRFAPDKDEPTSL